jgi:PAS domain S-box-containing protein
MAGWLGGLRARIIATFTSVLLVHWFLIEPVNSFKVLDLRHGMVSIIFVFMGLAFSFLHYFYKQQLLANFRTNEQLENMRIQGLKLNLAIESARLGTWSWDIKSDQLVWSDNMYLLFGIPAETPMDFEKFLAILHPDDREATSRAVSKSIQEGLDFECEYRIIWPDQSIHWAVGVGRAYKDEHGQAVRMEGIVRNIEHRKKLELDLQEDKERLGQAQRIAGIASWKLNLSGQFDCSDELYSLLGVSSDFRHNNGISFVKLIHPDDQSHVNDWLKKCLRGQKPESIIFRRFLVNGNLRFLTISGELQHDLTGKPILAMGAIQDITNQYLKDELIHTNEERHRLALDSMALGEWELDLETKSTTRSKRHDEIFGYEELLPAWTYDTFLSHVIDEDKSKVFSQFQPFDSKTKQVGFECRIQRKDNIVRWIQISALKSINHYGHEVMVGIIKDINDRKVNEVRLKESELRFRSLFEYLPIAYQALDEKGLYIDANQAMADILGFKNAKDLLGRSFIHFIDFSKEKSIEILQNEITKNGRLSGELALRRFDGTPITVDLSARAQVDSEGKFICGHYIAIDITERRAMESKIIELNLDLEKKVSDRTLQLAAANASKSLFLASMSHEIRTPLNAVLGLTQVLYDEKLNPEQKEIIHKISLSGKSLLNIVDDILDFSKIEAGQLEIYKKPFSIEELIVQVRSVIDVSAKSKGLQVKLEYPQVVLGQFLGDAQRIGQVFLNLAGNAVKFTSSGTVVIRVIQLSLTEATARLRFEIEDTGIGIKEEVLSTLFRPFIQADHSITRRFGGTGLGLSICKRLVELMGGKIGVNSVFGQGSKFWFELTFDRMQVENRPQTSQSLASSESKNQLKGLNILVVDDSQDNLFLAELVLKKVGAQVTMANNGAEAFDLLKVQSDKFKIILMDIEMPVMDGLTATRKIRRELKLENLPIIALSAGVLAEEKQKALDAGMNDFLSKPTNIKVMIEVISRYTQKPELKESQIGSPGMI